LRLADPDDERKLIEFCENELKPSPLKQLTSALHQNFSKDGALPNSLTNHYWFGKSRADHAPNGAPPWQHTLRTHQ